MTDPAESMIQEQGRRAQAIVSKADFTRCDAGPDMKDVYRFMVDGIVALLDQQAAEKAKCQQSVIGPALASGGGGAIIIWVLQAYFKTKGWL